MVYLGPKTLHIPFVVLRVDFFFKASRTLPPHPPPREEGWVGPPRPPPHTHLTPGWLGVAWGGGLKKVSTAVSFLKYGQSSFQFWHFGEKKSPNPTFFTVENRQRVR